MKKLKNYTELTSMEAASINGGGDDEGAAELVGLGIAQGLSLMTGGLLGYAWVTYNYFKD